MPLRQIVVGTVAPESLDQFIETLPLLGQPSLQHTHMHAELLGNQWQTATLYRHHAQDQALDLIHDIRCRLQVEPGEILLQCLMQKGGLLLDALTQLFVTQDECVAGLAPTVVLK